MLLAAGAVLVKLLLERCRSWARAAIIITLLSGGIWLAPMTVPVLPADGLISYMNTLPFGVPRSEKSHAAAVLPQYYADQFGWEEMAQSVARAWNRVPPLERPMCAIFAQNYGEAGAIDFFGPRYGLPSALSGHQSYWIWGPRGYSGQCLLVIGETPERLAQLFERVEYAGTSNNPYALERHVPIYICRGARFGSLAALWPRLKKWR